MGKQKGKSRGTQAGSRGSKRQFPDNKSNKRSASKRNIKKTFYIFCEGKNTEPDYLKQFAAEYSNGLVHVKTVRDVGAPITVVEAATRKKKSLKKKAYAEHDVFVAMVDVDEHPHFPETKERAKEKGILLIISNPCFEIWPLWHLQDHTRNIHRYDLQKLLKKAMPHYDHKKKAQLDYTCMRGSKNYHAAKKRAEHSNQQHESGGTEFPNNNPSSNIYTLLDDVIAGGKK